MKKIVMKKSVARKIIGVLLALVIALSTPLVAFAGVGDNLYNESEPNNYLDYANIVYSDYTVCGYMDKYDMDVYRFSVSSKVDLTFILTSESSAVGMAFYDSTGSKIKDVSRTYSNGYYHSTFIGTATAGTYYIGVQPSSTATASDVFYMFYIEYSSVSAPHTHSYDNACDATCNGCGATRSVTHTYSNACDATCNICGATRTASSHSYSNDCDASCNVCGATREPYDHVYTDACDTSCNECNATRTAPHYYDSVCDEVCDGCGYERVAQHNYENAFDTTCDLCGETRRFEMWQVEAATTGVYNIRPSKTLSGFSKDDITVVDKDLKEVKYNDSKYGWPLVAGQQYTVILYGDYSNTDDLSWNLTKQSSTIFPDTEKDAWYSDAVTYSVGAGIIGGYQNGKFGTSDSIQRQDFLVILARLAGVDLEDYKYRSSFPDVARNSYYEAAVNWGAENGIVTGYNNGKFGVGDKVTREQLVTFLRRYAAYKGYDSGYNDDIETSVSRQYKDYKNVSDFATDAILWAIEKGVISGKTSSTIVPQGNAQRCEVAKIMYNIFLNDIFK